MDSILEFRWTTSRARESYGWNICTLYFNGKKVASTRGGGYDMKGTALGNWAMEQFQERLQDIAHLAYSNYARIEKAYVDIPRIQGAATLYGMTTQWTGMDLDRKPQHVSLDGGCGWESVINVLKKIGVQVEYRSGDGQKRQMYTVRDTLRAINAV